MQKKEYLIFGKKYNYYLYIFKLENIFYYFIIK